jgi:LPXTG-site transpeptidase (sortase) family protein
MKFQLSTKTGRIKSLTILIVSLVLLFASASISYAKYESDRSLASPKAGVISGKYAIASDGNATSRASIIVPEYKVASAPSRINIPDIGVDAPIEHLGLTADNAVDVPKSLWTTAWFNKSSKPGEKGPAMIVGHYSAYGRAVFANLKKLGNGQKIIVTDDKGQQFTFAVVKIADYPQAEVPMAQLLGNRSSKPRLEIITCGGNYIKDSRDFTNRTVVTAEIVES